MKNEAKDLVSSSDEDEVGADFKWTKNDILHEIRQYFELGITSTLTNVGFVASPLLTASFVGRNFPPVYLSAFTLANLMGNLSTFTLLWGLFSASDTLQPQAFGRGDFAEVGRLAIRGYIVNFCVIFPLNVILYVFFYDIMIALGQDAEASMYACQWYRIFCFLLPFAVLYNCLWKYLTAQQILKPLIMNSIICIFVVLPLCLNICIKAFGFKGSAIGYVIYQFIQAFSLLYYLYLVKPHEAKTWKGLSYENIVEALDWDQTMYYLHLGVGGIVAQCEWIFWEGMGLVVGLLGVIPLTVHTIPNQTIVAFCMCPFAFGTALAVRMGISLTISVRRTQEIVIAAIVFVVIYFGIFSILVQVLENVIVGVFTHNEEVKAGAHEIWSKVSIFNFSMSIFGTFSGIATGLGMQWPLGIINFVFLFLFGLPVIYYTSVVLDQGLNAAWFWMNIAYLGMNVTFTFLFIFADWRAIQKKALISSEKDKEDTESKDKTIVNESTSLL